MLCTFLVFMQMLWFFFYAWDLDSYVVISESHFDLDVLYHLGYFYVMYYMCDDIDSCKCGHRNA